MFPSFKNTFITQAEMLKVNLFRPSRKKNYGYLERGNMRSKHMIFLPAKSGSDLSHYLHTIDYATRFEGSKNAVNYPYYNWFSMVVFPHNYDKSYGNYGKSLEHGFVEMKKATANNEAKLNDVFPKVAALASYVKDKKVPNGWIAYKDKMLLICSGNARASTKHKKAPPGTAFAGDDQHDPQSSKDILCQKKIAIQSLHHLLCVTEGLLRTL